MQLVPWSFFLLLWSAGTRSRHKQHCVFIVENQESTSVTSHTLYALSLWLTCHKNCGMLNTNATCEFDQTLFPRRWGAGLARLIYRLASVCLSLCSKIHLLFLLGMQCWAWSKVRPRLSPTKCYEFIHDHWSLYCYNDCCAFTAKAVWLEYISWVSK